MLTHLATEIADDASIDLLEATTLARMTPTTVDVVVTTHDGWRLTERCLEHLQEQTIAHTVIVSDGASTDGTPQRIRARFPHVRLLTCTSDPGYATATNRGVEAGNGDVIVLLNNDAYCRPDFLEYLVQAFEDARVGAVAPLTLRPDERTIDGVGLTVDATLAPFIRLTGRSHEDAELSRPLLTAPGSGADAYRRSAWIAAGGFDERLSFYGADMDLGLRLRALGWTAAAEPRAVAIHERSATSGHRSERARNSGGWARGFLLRRWGILSSRAGLRTVLTEGLVAIADVAISRDAVALRSRIRGWKAAGGVPRLEVPRDAIAREIGFVESLRLRWAAR
jgi:GT2 family glycosyltransferase